MINPMDMTNRTILVTGASSGIGREISVLLSQLGARLILVGRNSSALDKTLSMLEGKGHFSEAYDLAADIDDIPRWMKIITQKSGLLHGLVHSAGMQFTRPLRITTGESMDELMRINATAALCLAKGFRQKGVSSGGSIVYLTSVMGLVGQTGQVVYSASKGALVALSKSLALEMAREGVRVNCVAPAVVKSEMSDKMFSSLSPENVAQIETMHPLGIGTPRDVAYSIAFLLAETGRWITGSTLVVDGGYTAH